MADTRSSGLKQLEHVLGHCFVDKRLLAQALTHRSASAQHNERLEFLGDAVLELVVSQLLYARFLDAPEGDLSRIRASLVCGGNLQQIALQLDLDKLLRLGAGERKSGGQRRESNLANALEAVLGAVYVDAGYAVAERVTEGLFADVDWDMVQSGDQRDAKTRLQEFLQAKKWALPKYVLMSVDGPEHQLVFTVQCEVVDVAKSAVGTGTSKRQAQQNAAANVLALLADTVKSKER